MPESKKLEEFNLNPEVKEQAVRSEVEDYLSIKQQRRWIFPRAALVGACAGLVALAFRAALTEIDYFRNQMIMQAKASPAIGWLLPVLFTLIGALLSVFLVSKYSPEAAGSGIPHLEAVLHRFRKLNWRSVLPVKFVGGLAAIGGGLALGREGPTVQMGGAVGDAIARLLKVTERERLTLISAGAGAGLAAAFNAPLSGLIFVLEEIRRDFQPIVFGAAFIAAVIADIIARIGTGQFPVFAVPSYPLPPLGSLIFFAILGVLAGLLGVLFNRSLLTAQTLFSRIPVRRVYIVTAVIGGMIGLIGWFQPQLIGSGHVLAEFALKGHTPLLVIPLFFIIRLLLTSLSYSTGAAGGIFAPLLVLGALLGLGVGEVAHQINPQLVPIPGVFAVVGMAAYFTAVVRAPLTGIMLIVEMTGNYSQMLPLLVSCFIAYIVAEALKDLPIYEALLERDLKRLGVDAVITDPVVVEFTIQADAPFSGMHIRDLGLPPGCIIIRCKDGKREWVPKANTRLDADMLITAVISPDAKGGMEILRQGCKAD